MKNRIPLALSTTALLVAVLGVTSLGRAAYDVVIPRNSVGTLQLKRNAVTSSKLAPNTVRGSQVVDGSLLTQDFKSGQIPQGPKGDKGDRGATGPPGLSGYEIVTATGTVSANATLFAVQAQCPAGKNVLGGTQITNGLQGNGVFFGADIILDGTLYSVVVHNTNATPRTVTVQAVCAKVAS
jgi:hypothetical protein